MIKVNAIAVNDTPYYCFLEEDKEHIKEIYTVYCYNSESRVYDIEIEPRYELRYLYRYLVLKPDVPKELREELIGRYCFDYEETHMEDTWMWCSRVDGNPTVKDCGEFEDLESAAKYLEVNRPI